MLVWVCAAYVAVSAIKAVHGTVSVNLVANYLIAMCVAQCVLAFVISQVPSIENLVNSIFLTGSKEMTKGRLDWSRFGYCRITFYGSFVYYYLHGDTPF